MKKVSLLMSLCCGLLFPAITFAQSVLAADGGSSRSSGITIDWTLGELATATVSTPRGMITEGFQQPYLSVAIVPAPAPIVAAGPKPVDYNISLAPNPVQHLLQVNIQHTEAIPMTLRLVHPNGQLLLQQAVNSLSSFEIDFSTYPSGLYLIQFLETKGRLIETYKVTKF